MSISNLFESKSGRNFAITLRLFETTKLGISGTSHPVSGHFASRQHKNALARLPSLSCSIPRTFISLSTASTSFCCAISIFSLSLSDAPIIFVVPQVNIHAIGFRSLANASQPILAASKGIEPPPENTSPTFGLCPNLRMPSCSTRQLILSAFTENEERCEFTHDQTWLYNHVWSHSSGRLHNKDFSSYVTSRSKYCLNNGIFSLSVISLRHLSFKPNSLLSKGACKVLTSRKRSSSFFKLWEK